MVIALIGESCTGKSTLAGMLKEKLGALVFSGKDYLRLAKGEGDARQAFCSRMRSRSFMSSARRNTLLSCRQAHCEYSSRQSFPSFRNALPGARAASFPHRLRQCLKKSTVCSMQSRMIFSSKAAR